MLQAGEFAEGIVAAFLEVSGRMPTVKTNPMKLPGPWVEGYALDYHSVKSTPTGDPNHPFETERTELGELVFRLKYRSGGNTDIVDTALEFVKKWKPNIECVVPAPPSRNRNSQPVVEIARALGDRLGLPVCEDAVVKVKKTSQMKNIEEWAEREKVLADAIQAGPEDVKGRSILLVDDLTESGSTLRRTATVLLKGCSARAVYALVLTRTR